MAEWVHSLATTRHASGEAYWKNLTTIGGGCLRVPNPLHEFERTYFRRKT
jgi:hypothetical protein